MDARFITYLGVSAVLIAAPGRTWRWSRVVSRFIESRIRWRSTA